MASDDENNVSSTQERLGETPETIGPDGDAQGTIERCRTDRDEMSPKDTADCAGLELAELYQNEEDGGS